jgi:hypothetical protein
MNAEEIKSLIELFNLKNDGKITNEVYVSDQTTFSPNSTICLRILCSFQRYHDAVGK